MHSKALTSGPRRNTRGFSQHPSNPTHRTHKIHYFDIFTIAAIFIMRQTQSSRKKKHQRTGTGALLVDLRVPKSRYDTLTSRKIATDTSPVLKIFSDAENRVFFRWVAFGSPKTNAIGRELCRSIYCVASCYIRSGLCTLAFWRWWERSSTSYYGPRCWCSSDRFLDGVLAMFSGAEVAQLTVCAVVRSELGAI